MDAGAFMTEIKVIAWILTIISIMIIMFIILSQLIVFSTL